MNLYRALLLEVLTSLPSPTPHQLFFSNRSETSASDNIETYQENTG